MSEMSESPVTILAFHGSKAESAQVFSSEVFDKLRSGLVGEVDLRLAYLFNGEPGFEDVLENLLSAGIDQVRVFPLLLLPGSHQQKDLPEMIRRAEQKYPVAQIELGGSLCEDSSFVDWLGTRLKG